MPGCTMTILSDANSVFITEILEHHHMLQHITEVSRRYTRWIMISQSLSWPAHPPAHPTGCISAEHCRG